MSPRPTTSPAEPTPGEQPPSRRAPCHRAASPARRPRAVLVAGVALTATAVVAAGTVGVRTATDHPGHDPAASASTPSSSTPTPAPVLPSPVAVAEAENAGSTGGRHTRRVALVPGSRSIDDIPTVALGAYQRATTVMNAASPKCRISWELIAAIGRVESNHGTAAGHHLTDTGVARPGVIGPRIAHAPDSDAGQLDHDQAHDHAVGPMQFMPSTWTVVAVDADGDGTRNPQNINDAALAAGVYLCSGGDDLSTRKGRTAATWTYNRSTSYGRQVEAIYQRYVDQADQLAAQLDDAPDGQVLDARALSTTSPTPKTEDRTEADSDADSDAGSDADAADPGTSGSTLTGTGHGPKHHGPKHHGPKHHGPKTSGPKPTGPKTSGPSTPPSEHPAPSDPSEPSSPDPTSTPTNPGPTEPPSESPSSDSSPASPEASDGTGRDGPEVGSPPASER